MVFGEEARLLMMRILQNFVRETRGRWEASAWAQIVERVRRLGFETVTDERMLRLAEDNRERWLAGENGVGPPPVAPAPTFASAPPAFRQPSSVGAVPGEETESAQGFASAVDANENRRAVSGEVVLPVGAVDSGMAAVASVPSAKPATKKVVKKAKPRKVAKPKKKTAAKKVKKKPAKKKTAKKPAAKKTKKAGAKKAKKKAE
jgi:hypothetical protein